MVDLQRPGQDQVYSAATGINNKGQVIGDANNNAFRWSPRTGMQNLVSLGFDAEANAINDAGTVVGRALTPDSFDNPLYTPVRWTEPDRILALASAGYLALGAQDINAAGHIVGSTFLESAPFGPDHAFLWTPQKGLIDLGTGSGDFSDASRINDKGMVIGGLGVVAPTFFFRGFVWTRETGIIEIGAPNVLYSRAKDLNNLGQVVGSIEDRAYVWTRAEGVVDLNTRIPNAPPGMELWLAMAISDNGSILASANTGLVLLVPQASSSNEAPVVGPIKATGTPHTNIALSFAASFKDADLRDTHKATWSWGDGSKDTGTVSEKNGTGSVSGQHTYRAPGIYTVRLTVTDSNGKSATVERKVVVCGSNTYVAGEGWFMSPDGASKAAPNQSGVASFAFLSETGKNMRQAQAKGNILFDALGLNFRSDYIDSLVLQDTQAEYRGSGTVNGAGGYKFMLTAIFGAKSGGGKDRIRIRIWHQEPGSRAEVVDYDNMIDSRALGTDGEGTAVGDGAFRLPSS